MKDSETIKPNDGGESQATKESLDAWYYLVGDKTCGPSTAQEIRNQIASRVIPDGTFVFREGMGDWTKARTLPEFACSSSPSPGRPTGTASAESARTNIPIALSKAKAPTLNSGRAKPDFISKGIIISVLATILAIGMAGVTIHGLQREKAERLALEARQQEEAKQKEAARLAEEGRIAMERLRQQEAARQQEEARKREQAQLAEQRKEAFSFSRVSASLETAGFRFKHKNKDGRVSFYLNENQKYPVIDVEIDGDCVTRIAGEANALAILAGMKTENTPRAYQEGLLKNSVLLCGEWADNLASGFEAVVKDSGVRTVIHDTSRDVYGLRRQDGEDWQSIELENKYTGKFWNVTVTAKVMRIFVEAQPAE